MYDPDSYDAYSQFQRRDARELIPKITKKMDWRKADNILDFGCGSGFNTKNILLPRVVQHENVNPLIYGVDVSNKMIDFASVNYSSPNIVYMQADVLKDDCEFPCKFDKIFSFHVLHWILDQEKAFKHLYDLLNVNGEVGMYFIATAAVFSVYERMAENPKWTPYLADVKNFIPRTHYSPDPAQNTKDALNRVGYTVQESRRIIRKFTFDSLDEMIAAAMAANPFIHRIPDELQAEYKQDFRDTFQPFVHQTPTTGNQSAVEVDYALIMVVARKN